MGRLLACCLAVVTFAHLSILTPAPPHHAAAVQGGKEATRSNALLHKLIVDAVAEVAPGVGRDLIGLVTSRDEIDELLRLHDVIDLVIPRGSNQLVRATGAGCLACGRCRLGSKTGCSNLRAVCTTALVQASKASNPGNSSGPCFSHWQVSYIQQHTKIPVLGHADGICHIYVDAAADMDKARRICVDAKVDYPAACNAGACAGTERRGGAAATNLQYSSALVLAPGLVVWLGVGL